MIHISIEGMDGVGKTTVCKLLSEELGYEFVEKPLYSLLSNYISIDEYKNIIKAINKSENRIFTSWFHSLNNIYLYEMYKDKKIITDRHILSNYSWSGTETNKDIYDLLIKILSYPTLTVILYASNQAISLRLKNRNSIDPDIKKLKYSENIYDKMISLCELYKFPYIIIDTTKLLPNDVVSIIKSKMGEINV